MKANIGFSYLRRGFSLFPYTIEYIRLLPRLSSISISETTRTGDYIDTKTKKIFPQEEDALMNEKAGSAHIFYAKYLLARENEEYKRMKWEFEE